VARSTRQRAVSKKIQRKLLANPSVVGFAETLRPKLVGGRETRVFAIRVFVEKKLPRNKVPPALLLPASIDGIPVDVVPIGKIVPFAKIANRKRWRPLKGGCSGIYTGGTAGTLGYFMRDKKKPPPKKGKPQWYALSCAHVLDPGNKKNETLQPSPMDKGIAPNDWVGKLYKSTYKNTDAALSKIDVGATAAVIGLPTPKGNAKPQKGLSVAKSGRSTGVRNGTITDLGLTFRFHKWGTAPGKVVFTQVIQVIGKKGKNFSEGGDSGSLVIHRKSGGAIGIVFAGGPGIAPKPTYVSPITLIQRAFPTKKLVLPGETYP
jgi:hypothetical protein